MMSAHNPTKTSHPQLAGNEAGPNNGTDPTIIRAILTVTERCGSWWVQCGMCDPAWQVPYFAA